MPTWHLGPARFSFSSVPPACIAVVGSKATMLTRSLCGSVHDYVRIPSSIKPLIRVVGVEDETSSAACWFGFHIHAKVGSAGQALPGLAMDNEELRMWVLVGTRFSSDNILVGRSSDSSMCCSCTATCPWYTNPNGSSCCCCVLAQSNQDAPLSFFQLWSCAGRCMTEYLGAVAPHL